MKSLYVIRNSKQNSIPICLPHRFPFYLNGKGNVHLKTGQEGPEGEANAIPWLLYPRERDLVPII
jgi:hypothetical protein